MPLINVFSSGATLEAAAAEALLLELSKSLSRYFGKPETWVMTCLVPRTAMTFGGSTESACYAEVKNVGTLTPQQAEEISADVCARLSRGLGVKKERIYVEFTNAAGHLWGWNGETFA